MKVRNHRISLGIILLTLAGYAESQTALTAPPTETKAKPAEIKGEVPYVPTPQSVVESMLKLANVGPNDYLIDLGSGDGRIPITAAKKFGIQALGIDINPARIAEAEEGAKKEGVSKQVQFMQKDLFDADISKAAVVTLYLLPSVNLKLRPKLFTDLKPGTRIVSHSFDMGDWKPEESVTLEGRTIHLWTIPKTIPKNLMTTGR